MHEFSIALGIVKIAEEESRKAKAKAVKTITLEIGKLSGVELQALEFAWPVAVKDTVLERAQRNVVVIEGKAKCLECGKIYDLNDIYDACPDCGGYFKDIIQGKELRIKTLDVE